MKKEIVKVYLNDKNTPVCYVHKSGSVDIIRYDHRGNIIKDSNGIYAYDDNNNLIYERGNHYIYNSYNKKIASISVSSGKLSKILYIYDECGNLIKEDHPDSKYYLEFKYNTNGQKIEKLCYEEHEDEEYDTYENEFVFVTKFKYQYSEKYNYDKNGKLISIVDITPGKEDKLYHEWKYDNRGNIIYFYDAWEESKEFYKYDDSNNKIYYKCIEYDGAMEEIEYKYDENNRLTEEIVNGFNINNKNRVPYNYHVIYKYYFQTEMPEDIRIKYYI